ncbi:MAG: hypothetical protein C0610_11250 [Desulfobacteraceae bacterium]|nr:MAG: hypothetical protein C0610_11250 [Desulfobacteraceae bacterium]
MVRKFYKCLNSCNLFAEQKCPQQQLLEKLFLFPQITVVEDLERICKSQCCTSEILSSDHAENVLESLRQIDHRLPADKQD